MYFIQSILMFSLVSPVSDCAQLEFIYIYLYGRYSNPVSSFILLLCYHDIISLNRCRLNKKTNGKIGLLNFTHDH